MTNPYKRPCWGGPCTDKGMADPGFCVCKAEAAEIDALKMAMTAPTKEEIALRAEIEELRGLFKLFVGNEGFKQHKYQQDEIDRLTTQSAGLTSDITEICQERDDLRKQLEAANAELADLESLFDLQREADMRAVKRWRDAHPGNDLVMPDRSDMVVWLLDEVIDADAELREQPKRIIGRYPSEYPSEHDPLELPEYPSAEASWMACDAYHAITAAHPDDRPYVIAQYLDAFAKRYGANQQETRT